jgi:predicted amidohydrolase YtcJ
MAQFECVIKNTNIVTLDGDKLSRKHWMALNSGLVAALGDGGDIPSGNGELIDLKGKTILPGLTDTHAHATMTGIGRMGIDLAGAATIDEVLGRVRDFCKDKRDDAPVFGLNLPSADQLKDGRLPTRFELDKVTGNYPVMLVLWTVHGGILNSEAIPFAKLEEKMRYVEKDGFFNDDETSFHVIGLLFGMLTSKDYRGIYFEIAKYCASVGITTLHALDGMMVKDDRDTEALKDILDELPIELVPYTQTFDYEKIHGYGMKQIGGCLSLDGSPPQLTAAYSESYPIAPHTRGFLTYTDAQLYHFVTEVSKRGMQVAFHAIGDRAIDQILYIYRQVDREIGIRNLRHRIEHFSTPSDKHLEMAAEMNIIASAQPEIGNMLDNKGGSLFKNFAPEHIAAYHENFRRVMEAGIVVTGGSDSPVTPLDCFVGLNSAVNAYNPERRVSFADALRMYTVNAAYAEHKEDIKGTLAVGKQADFIVLDKDPSLEKGVIDRSVITVEETWKKGKRIFRKDGD